MTGIKHSVVVTLPNNPAFPVSRDAWNAEHIKGTILDVLSDHNLAAHVALGLLPIDGSVGMIGDVYPASHYGASLGKTNKWWYSVRSWNTDFQSVSARGKYSFATFAGDVILQAWTGAAWLEIGKVAQGASPDIAFSRCGDITLLSAKTLDLATNGAYFKPRRLSQVLPPTPEVGELMIWHDSDQDFCFLMYNDPTLGVKSEQLT